MTKPATSRNFDPEVYKKDQWRWQEGEYTVTRTTQWSGPGCHDGCGVLLYQDADGKVVKVEGDPNNGFNQGVLCMRCLNLVEALEHPDRIKYPLKRAGERGENKWERISWDEAYDLVIEKARYYQETYGNECIEVVCGTGRNVTWQPPYMAYAGFQTSNMVGGYLSGDSCYAPRASEMAVMNGDFLIADLSQALPGRFDDPEYVLPEVILIWGNNPLISNSDGFFGHWIVEAMRRGSKLIVVDPKLTWLAAKADIWLRVRPGSDVALAIAMLKTIIDEDLYDHDFVDNWTYGFNAFKERCDYYDYDQLVDLSWCEKDKVVAAARMYANAKPATLQWGLPVDQSVNGVPLGQALDALWTITGNTDIPGGNIVVDNAFKMSLLNSTSTGIEQVDPEVIAKRIGVQKYPMRNTGTMAMAHTDEVLLAIESGDPYPIRMAWIQGSNPIANQGAEAPRVYEAMKKVEFNVILDLFITPTAVAVGDLLLPVAMGPERDSIRAWYYPLRAIKKVTEFAEARSDEQILHDLIPRLNPTMNLGKDVPDWMNISLKTGSLADFSYEELVEKVEIWDKFEYRKHERGLNRPDGKPGFNTPTGKIELLCTALEYYGYDPLPYYEEPRESPYSTPELAEKYPLILTTGARSWEFFHSEHRQMPTMRESHPYPLVELHPDAAAERGIVEGEWVWIENQRGRCKQIAKFNKTLDPRVVAAEHGWWYPEREAAEPSLYGVFDSNINNLTTQNDVGPTGFGAPYKGLLCNIYKVTPQNDEVQPTEQVVEKGGFDYVRK